MVPSEERHRVIDDFSPTRANNKANDTVIVEGDCYLLTKQDRLKRHWIVLMGKELYIYKSKDELQHLLMHSLASTFVSQLPEERLCEGVSP